MDKSVILVDEGSGKHPADFEFHAYVEKDDLHKFDAPLQIKIKECSETEKMVDILLICHDLQMKIWIY